MGAQRLRGSQGRLHFTGVIDRGGKWNQDALDAHDLRAPAVQPFATTLCLLMWSRMPRCWAGSNATSRNTTQLITSESPWSSCVQSYRMDAVRGGQLSAHRVQ